MFCFCVENFRHVLGIDVDPESLEIAGENVTDLEVQYPVLQTHAIQCGLVLNSEGHVCCALFVLLNVNYFVHLCS